MLHVQTVALDPIMDAPTALHCADCGETLYVDRCLNPECATAARRESVPGETRKFRRGEVSGPMLSPRAWTLGGQVD